MPPRAIAPSGAVEAARARRSASTGKSAARIQWFIKEVSDKVELTMKQRVGLATQLLKDKVVKNISIAVVKAKGARGGTVVVQRSKPGEFPRADTTQLMKTIFSDRRKASRGVWDGFVGTPLSYGVILETRMNRSFLVRTLNEQRTNITRLLTGPLKV